MPKEDTDDPALKLSGLYVDLRQAIRWEDGPHIINLPLEAVATTISQHGKEELRCRMCSHTCQFECRLPQTHPSPRYNRTVNVEGIPGKRKPIDQMMGHYNL